MDILEHGCVMTLVNWTEVSEELCWAERCGRDTAVSRGVEQLCFAPQRCCAELRAVQGHEEGSAGTPAVHLRAAWDAGHSKANVLHKGVKEGQACSLLLVLQLFSFLSSQLSTIKTSAKQILSFGLEVWDWLEVLIRTCITRMPTCFVNLINTYSFK